MTPSAKRISSQQDIREFRVLALQPCLDSYNPLAFFFLVESYIPLLLLYSKKEAVAMEMELLRDYHFGLHQLTEILGHACAVAITKV